MTHSQKRKEARISAGHMRLNHKDLSLAYLPATNKPKSSLKDDRVIQNLTLPLHFFLHIIRTYQYKLTSCKKSNLTKNQEEKSDLD